MIFLWALNCEWSDEYEFYYKRDKFTVGNENYVVNVNAQ